MDDSGKTITALDYLTQQQLEFDTEAWLYQVIGGYQGLPEEERQYFDIDVTGKPHPVYSGNFIIEDVELGLRQMMSNIRYINLTEVEPELLLPILNKPSTRTHLMPHDEFGLASVTSWVDSKSEVDAQKGCRVRAILVEGNLAGWCGIQLEQGKYELAIVLEDNYWGIGKNVFFGTINMGKRVQS